ncbi:unnamed protein product [Urochloa decumbens]|uniref:Protein kinase domain-containing protein n=1 Tax=Urochloa decumbens TaxID=240449 RepID=A0ABC9C0B5_9POAL
MASYHHHQQQCLSKPCPYTGASLWLLLQLLLVLAGTTQTLSQQMMGLLPNCTTLCGGVAVPYPFGIEPEAGCYLLGFNLTCDTAHTPPRLLLWLGHLRHAVTNISPHDYTLRFRPKQIILTSNKVPLHGTKNGTHHGHGHQQRPGCHLFSDELTLDWEVGSSALRGLGPNGTRAGNATCPHDLGSAACHSTHSTCMPTAGSRSRHRYNGTTGYVCKCDPGYLGNPYLTDGCQDIDECTLEDKCYGDCTNLPGTYLCQCPKGTTGYPYTPNGCTKTQDNPNTGLIIGIGVGSGAMLPFLILGNTFVVGKIKSQRNKKLRQRFFKQNRGQLLQQLVCQKTDIAERMIVTLEELEKATNNFDKARELSGGGHGTVYKGILSSLHVVAIKKSKIVIQKEINEFINEVAILSQINHKNIVKLFGYCLETEVPLLVYEFISNGTLHNHLHARALVSLSWRDRLRIAVETARALAYLHSHVSMPIIHRDVKSPNILLDDSLTVKLSDFGASRYVSVDETGLDTTVQGTFGYLDPVYHSTGHLTEKSDVYSFGVTLIELLTRKQPVSYRSPHGHGLVYHFVTLLSEGNLAQILDSQVTKEGGGEVVDIALLAAMCVKFVSTDRPTMRQVEMTLESIHAAKEYTWSDDVTDESDEYYMHPSE